MIKRLANTKKLKDEKILKDSQEEFESLVEDQLLSSSNLSEDQIKMLNDRKQARKNIKEKKNV